MAALGVRKEGVRGGISAAFTRASGRVPSAPTVFFAYLDGHVDGLFCIVGRSFCIVGRTCNRGGRGEWGVVMAALGGRKGGVRGGISAASTRVSGRVPHSCMKLLLTQNGVAFVS